MSRSGSYAVKLAVFAACLSGSSWGCSADGFVAPETVGDVSIKVATTGRHIDVDGYTLLMDSQILASVGSNDGAILTRVASKSYVASLSGLAPNCRLAAGDTGRVEIRPNVTTQLNFQIACAASERIAFSSERDGHPQIYVMELDGSGQARVTFSSTSDSDPTWSPDGNRIAFASLKDEVRSNIAIANVDRSGISILGGTNPSGYPAWSADGSQIAFASVRTGNADIFLMNADGTNERQITDSPDIELRPAWSTDGTKLIFDAAPPATFPVYNVWSMNVDGLARTQLTSNQLTTLNPQISSDGKKIVFQSVSSSRFFDVYVMNADGSEVTQITSDPSDDKDPFWSADGARIVFSSNRSGNLEIYVMNADGTNVIQLTNSSGADYDPAWSR